MCNLTGDNKTSDLNGIPSSSFKLAVKSRPTMLAELFEAYIPGKNFLQHRRGKI